MVLSAVAHQQVAPVVEDVQAGLIVPAAVVDSVQLPVERQVPVVHQQAASPDLLAAVAAQAEAQRPVRSVAVAARAAVANRSVLSAKSLSSRMRQALAA